MHIVRQSHFLFLFILLLNHTHYIHDFPFKCDIFEDYQTISVGDQRAKSVNIFLSTSKLS